MMISSDPAERNLALSSLFRSFLLLAQMLSCSFFVRPKKEPKKGRRKEQLRPFWTPATRGLEGAAKKAEVGFAELAKF
jgi:hypothetical protein